MKYRAIDPGTSDFNGMSQAEIDDYWMRIGSGLQQMRRPSWELNRPDPPPIAPESRALGEVLIVLLLVALTAGALAVGIWSFS